MNLPVTDPDTNHFQQSLIRFHGQEALRLWSGDGSEAIVLLQGGQLVSWKTTGGVERLYLSPQAVYGAPTAVRGGVPVIFPQFAERGPLPRHGFARTQAWSLLSAECTAGDALAVLGLQSGDASRAVWPFEFSLELSLRVSASRLDIELAVFNTGDEAWSFAAALHTYLALEDLTATRLSDMNRLRYEDSLTGKEHLQTQPSLQLDGEVDRIYFDAARDLSLHGGRQRDELRITQAGFQDVVVWNPGPLKAAALSDMPRDDWLRMLCVEAARIGQPVRLQPGDEWVGRQSIEVQSEP